MVHALHSNGANTIWEHSLLDPTNSKSGRKKPQAKDPIKYLIKPSQHTIFSLNFFTLDQPRLTSSELSISYLVLYSEEETRKIKIMEIHRMEMCLSSSIPVSEQQTWKPAYDCCHVELTPTTFIK